jgi:ferritin-like metal-binding protein YciE
MEQIKNNEEFTGQLQTLWSAESMLVEAMPRMIQKATNFGLQKSLAHHFAETDQHKIAIESICKQLDIDPRGGEPNAQLQNILMEGEKAMLGMEVGDDMDAAIITGAQQIEEYEISAYVPVADNAEALGYIGIAKRLRLTLEEEQQAENKLKFLEGSLFKERAEIGYEMEVTSH